MMSKLLSVVLLAVLTWCGSVWADAGASSFEFLLMGAGSRASAMGEAFTAVGGDAGSPYFNPATAVVMSGTEFSFMHISYLKDVSMQQFSMLSRAGELRFGIGFYLGNVSDLERRGNYPSREPLGVFDEHNFTASLLWAVPLGRKLSVGNAVKLAYEKLDLESATALALDFGAVYWITPELAVGTSLRNLGTRPRFVWRAFDLPRELRLGTSYKIDHGSPLRGLLLAADYIFTNWGNQSSKFNLGGEYSYRDLIYLRLGYDVGYDSRSFAVGGGISYLRYFFDYAYVPTRHNLRNTHRFTLRIKL